MCMTELTDTSSTEHEPLTAAHDSEEFGHPHELCSKKAQEDSPWRAIMMKVGTSVGLFLLVSLLLERMASERVAMVSHEFVEHVGLPGLFFGVLIGDGVPQPLTYVPLIFVAVKGGIPKPMLIAVCMGSSYCAALCGYMIGRFLRGPDWGRQRFNSLSERYPQIPELMEKKGSLGVLLAAMMPVPLAMATWTAGFFGVSLPGFLLAALGRFPKIILIVLLCPGPGPDSA